MKLNAAEWARVETLYPQAAELPAGERERFLAAECAQEPRVRAEIEAMLEAAEGGEDDLVAPVGLTASERMADLLPEGTRLGSWKVKALIGHGGMGEVYLAERADGAYTMNAAVKLLKRELFTYANAQGFLRERRVLARLSHPNIARVLDAGTTDDGRPYLVMEYVHGARITDYARARNLGPRDAARLMLAVAEAVAEAHRQGVVHRDLKPANVLVTSEEQVKLLDFGIAKLMDEVESAKPGPTQLTPAYAAPEQILGQSLSPSTDIYALGVMLFQLLTHQLPHLREGLPLPVIAAGLRDETAERPSRVVLASAALFGESTRRRQAQALAGDLDWIVLKALQMSPARRYPTAGEFADDLRRYLEHLPVLARQDSFAYRLSRFVRRYPTQVAAIAAAILALTTGLAAALWQAHLARIEAARAERVKGFVLSVFKEQDPGARTHAEPLSPAQIVARGIERADAELQDNPVLHAEVLEDLGAVQAELTEPNAGRQTLERALAERRAVGGDDLPQAQTLRRIAQALTNEGRQAEAAARLDEAQAILARHGALEGVEAARVEMQRGFLQDFGKARGGSAAQHFLDAERIFAARLGPDDPETTSAMFYRGQALEQAREDPQALALEREVVARIERSAGPDSARLISPLGTIRGLLARAGALDEAEKTCERATAIARKHYGAVHMRVAELLREWADVEQARRRFGRADELFQEAWQALPESAEGDRAELLKDRGQLRIDMGRYAEAERDLAGSLAIYRRRLGDGNGFTWFVSSERGRALAGLGRLAEAEKVQREALARLATIMGAEAYQISLITDALATTLGHAGRHAEAAEQRRRSLALAQKKYPPTHRLVATREVDLAQDLYRQGAGAGEAAGLLDKAIPALRAGKTDPASLAEALILRARLFLDGKDASAARAALEEAIGLCQAAGNMPDELADAQHLLLRSG